MIKLPKLKIPRLDKRKKRFLMVALIALSFFVAGGIMFGPPNPLNIRNINDYSDIIYTVLPLSTELTEGDTVQAQLHDIKVVLTWDNTVSPNNPSKLRCTLKGGNFVEGDWVGWTGNDVYTWTFELSGAATGTNIHHFEFTGYYPTIDNPEWTYEGNSFSFYIHNLLQQIDPPEITTRPDDILMPDDGSEMMIWGYNYNAPNTITLTMDGTELKRQAGIESISDQVFSYTYSPTAVGIYTFTFSLDPEYILHPTISDTVSVEVIAADEYNLIIGVPDVVTIGSVVLTGQLSQINIPLEYTWDIFRDAPLMLPFQEGLIVTLLGESVIFETVKLVFFDAAEEKTEVFMTKVYVGIFPLHWEKTIDLLEFDAGEYTVSIRGRYLGDWYQISVFNLAVNTFPIGFVMVYGGIVLVLSIVTVIAIKGLREARGWFLFKGRYGK